MPAPSEPSLPRNGPRDIAFNINAADRQRRPLTWKSSRADFRLTVYDNDERYFDMFIERRDAVLDPRHVSTE